MFNFKQLIKSGAMLILGAIFVTTTPAEAAKKAPAPDPTVFIAPFSSSRILDNIPEYAWISDAMALAMDARFYQTPKINYISLRQVISSIRNEKFDRTELHVMENAMELARSLGADYAVVGTFKAEWPDVNFMVRVINVATKEVNHTFSVSGHLEDLIQLEGQIATRLAEFKPLSKMPVKEGRYGTKNLYAWREQILAQEILLAQSLAPNREVHLPEESVKEAMTHLSNALKLDPNFAPAHASVAMCQIMLKNVSQADLSIATALSADKNDPEAALAAYFIKWQQRQDGAALAELNSIIEKHPGYLLAWGFKGELLLATGRFQEAADHFDTYSQRVPSQVWAMSMKGFALSKLGKIEEAIEVTKAAVDMQPNSPILLLNLANRYIEAEKYQEAETKLKASIVKFPDFTMAYSRLSYVYLKLSNLDEAKAMAEKAITIADGVEQHKARALARLNLAHYYLLNKEISAAADALQLAAQDGLQKIDQIKNDPRCAEALTSPLLTTTLQKFKN